MKFLAAYDGSENSAEAVAKAVALAGEIGAELTILRVLNPLTDAIGEFAPSASEGLKIVIAREETQISELLEALGSPPATPLVEAFSHGETVARHIARVAADQNSDIVVIASKRASGVRGLLGESVAQQVIRLSPCPVLIVRPGA